ncbi:MAG: cytidylate kinase-like family protein [Desulfosarcina sp.]|nr:cytidylate kinase-like family protein [Desulfosarcina sp.]MBC2768165.1 cytidylate kinase-like family protein [Desulfosarcina sp.]
MAGKVDTDKYVPRTYATRKPGAEELVGRYVRIWESRQLAQKAAERASTAPSELPPCIAFSRKIGVGALEIADIVAEKLGFKVADRELIEQIANQTNISEKAIAYFDERFPGYVNRTYKYLFGEKSFIDSDYSRQLISAVVAIAGLESTVFIGRGSHLILPRERVLAVRCICSDDYRAKRIADIMHISEAEAKKKLPGIDKGQAAFFKKVYSKKAATPYEFDMVMNLDHFANPGDVADIVALAFNTKFKGAV